MSKYDKIPSRPYPKIKQPYSEKKRRKKARRTSLLCLIAVALFLVTALLSLITGAFVYAILCVILAIIFYGFGEPQWRAYRFRGPHD